MPQCPHVLVIDKTSFRSMSEEANVQLEFTFDGVKQVYKKKDLNIVDDDDDARDVNTKYSGTHDHGDLPLLKQTGELASILSNISSIKKESDTFLTLLIEQEQFDKKQATEAANANAMEIEVDQEAPTAASKMKLKSKAITNTNANAN